MRKSSLASLFLVVALAAAAPAPKPVITIAGVSTAVKIDAAKRSAVAANVDRLNAGLLKVIDLHRASDTASATTRQQIESALRLLHGQCMKLHDAIVGDLDPAQRTAFYTYVHAQLKAAGIDVNEFRDAMGADSAHAAMHGDHG